jgi:hypothetical protein
MARVFEGNATQLEKQHFEPSSELTPMVTIFSIIGFLSFLGMLISHINSTYIINFHCPANN